MNNLTKIRYVINEDKRTVVAIMEHCGKDAWDIFTHDFEAEGVDVLRLFLNIKNYLKDTYRAKAKCSLDDEWDVEIGKKIAREKMLAKYYRDLAKTMENYINIAHNIMMRFDTRWRETAERYEKYKIHDCKS